MPRDRKIIEKALLTKGFRSRPGDHKYFVYYFSDDTKSLVKTKTSHSPKMKSIGDNLLGQMARQCHLTKEQFLDLVDCPLQRAQYEAILRERDTPD